MPFAINYSKGKSIASHTLEEFRRQVWEKLKSPEKIGFDGLTDVELKKFKELLKKPDLDHHASDCEIEIEKRASVAKCNDLERYLEERLASFQKAPDQIFENKKFTSSSDIFKGLKPDEVFDVALMVIKSRS